MVVVAATCYVPLNPNQGCVKIFDGPWVEIRFKGAPGQLGQSMWYPVVLCFTLVSEGRGQRPGRPHSPGADVSICKVLPRGLPCFAEACLSCSVGTAALGSSVPGSATRCISVHETAVLASVAQCGGWVSSSFCPFGHWQWLLFSWLPQCALEAGEEKYVCPSTF